MYKLNEFYSLTGMTLKRGIFSKIRNFFFVIFPRILGRIKSLHQLIIVLSGTCRKIAAVFLFSFFVNPNDFSKIRNRDDANRRDKIIQTQIVKTKQNKTKQNKEKQSFKTPAVTVFKQIEYI